MNFIDYAKKIICIVIATVTSSVTLTSLILSFDWLTLLSCLVSIIITLCVSWITMLNNEVYWTEEYLLYAEMVEKKTKVASIQCTCVDSLHSNAADASTAADANNAGEEPLSKGEIDGDCLKQ